MPLVQGSSQKAIAENISRLYHENKDKVKPRPRNQILAIAESIAKKARKK